MPKTGNAYVNDFGVLKVTLSAANVAAIAAFTTAEDVNLEGVVVSFVRQNTPALPIGTQPVVGDTRPIVTKGKSIPENEVWQIVIVDDETANNVGEWGTDLLHAIEIFRELFGVPTQSLGGLVYFPDGDTAGKMATTLVSPEIISMDPSSMDAAANNVATRMVTLISENHTEARVV